MDCAGAQRFLKVFSVVRLFGKPTPLSTRDRWSAVLRAVEMGEERDWIEKKSKRRHETGH